MHIPGSSVLVRSRAVNEVPDAPRFGSRVAVSVLAESGRTSVGVVELIEPDELPTARSWAFGSSLDDEELDDEEEEEGLLATLVERPRLKEADEPDDVVPDEECSFLRRLLRLALASSVDGGAPEEDDMESRSSAPTSLRSLADECCAEASSIELLSVCEVVIDTVSAVAEPPTAVDREIDEEDVASDGVRPEAGVD